MLARLKVIPRSLARFPSPSLLFPSLVATALVGPSGLAWGADLLAPGPLEAQGDTGGVSSATRAPRGAMTSALKVEQSEAQWSDGGDASEAARLEAQRLSVLWGAALSRSVALSLGLHGTAERLDAGKRDLVFGAPADSSTEPKRTAFAGASLFLKVNLLERRGLALALAPFAESGAGAQAERALTRSVSPKAGVMALATYGARGVAQLTLNLGFRYRDPEEVGALRLRHEYLAKGVAKVDLSRSWGFFVGAEGRRLATESVEKEGFASQPTTVADAAASVQAFAGLTAALGQAELSALGGRRVSGRDELGVGRQFVGASLAWRLDGGRGSRGRPSVGAAIDEREELKKARLRRQEVEARQKEPGDGPDTHPEMTGAEIDSLKVLGGEVGPDFQDLDQRLAKERQEARTESPDARVERELRELREAEAKAAREQEIQERRERARARREATKQAREDQKRLKEWLEEAKAETDELGGIGRDELEWRGLE